MLLNNSAKMLQLFHNKNLQCQPVFNIILSTPRLHSYRIIFCYACSFILTIHKTRWMTLTARKLQSNFFEPIARKGFLKKEAGRKSRELTLTLVLLYYRNTLTITLGSIKHGQETTEQQESRFPQLLLLFLELHFE